MFRPLAAALLILSPTAAVAQKAETGRTPDRVRSVTLKPGEKCPPSTDNEVVVCGTIDPDEQYRVPKELRNKAEVPSQNQSWVNKAAAADQVGRVAGGLPNTCSPVGTGGATGCSIVNGRAWAAERRAAERNDALVPGGEQ